ncbi:MAG: hypothetical protein JEZ06_21575 [Anaerolineaceae bacterium]|nr:hypothetical protein [Anaerolineaceae bacterium]
MLELNGINWLQILIKLMITGIFTIVLCGLYVLLIIRLQRYFRVNRERIHAFNLTNRGNVGSLYQLFIEQPDSLFEFKLFENEVPLVKAAVPEEPEAPEIIEESTPQETTKGKKKKTRRQKAEEKKAAKAGDGAMDAGKQVAAKSGAAASFLGAVGGMLPGEAGKAMKEQSTSLRNVQTKTTQTMRAPESAKTKLKAASRDGGKLGLKAPGMPTAPGGSGSSQKTFSEENGETEISSDGAVTLTPKAHNERQRQINQRRTMVQTREVSAGEKLALSLHIKSKKRRVPEGSFLYSVNSQQVPLGKFDREILPLVKKGVVHFSKVESWRYWLPDLITVLILAAELLILVYVLTLIWL